MSWVQSIFVALCTALVGAAAAGFAAAGCVAWYRVSAREGGSAYFVAYIALLGLAVGFIAGLVLSRYFGGASAAGFFTGLGLSAGAIVSAAAIIALIAWGLADIPPTMNGHELNLVAEFRLPKGADRPPVIADKQFIWFETGPRGAASRAREFGALETAKATQIDGRWVVSGAVRIFTTRDKRSLTFALGEKEAVGFELRMPGHPGPEYKQWSAWIPDPAADHWPDSRPSFRFRIEERIPEEIPAPVDPFTALSGDSPLGQWLTFFDPFGRDPERYQAILKQAEAHPNELAAIIRSSNGDEFGRAISIAQALKSIDPAVLQAMRDAAAGMAEQIRQFNSMNPSQPGYAEFGNQIANRFNRWCPAWEMVQSRSGVDGRPPVEQILSLATVRGDNDAMQSVSGDARTLLGYLAAARTSTK